MATILIGADICPIEGNRPYFRAGDAPSLFHDLLGEFAAADFTVVNLECPLIEQPSPIRKTGPVFGEDSACVKGLAQAGIQVVSLANNHIMDHGAAGLKSTLEVCGRAGLTTVGAGKDLAAARQIVVRNAGGVRVGLLAMAEHEFSIATRDAWGANPLDLVDFVRNVKSRRGEFDYLIVLFHGGHEFQPISPRIKNVCHFLIEMGANAVIVQHPHSLGGCEDYLGGHIAYGQGALVMDEAIYRDLPSFHEGFLVKLTISPEGRSKLDLIPFVQSNPMPGARKMSGAREAEFRKLLAERSRAILDDGFVEEEWHRFCERGQHRYLSNLLGHSRVLRKLNATGLVVEWLYGRQALLGVRNALYCETHREALETIFDRRAGRA